MKNNFPIAEIDKKQSVLCLFCAEFGGENDVQHLYNAGFSNVMMVDKDLTCLLEMRDKFGYNAVCEDAFTLINELVTNRIHYDVVITDQWTYQDALINDIYYEKLNTIANKVMILGISQNYLNRQMHVPKGKYYKRSDHNGGVYWRVVKKQ